MKIPRVVFVLGLVSLLTDISSEMIYPLLPGFLAISLGASPGVIGLIEGVAETLASGLKLVSGRWSDQGWNKKKMLLLGYGISGALRPLVGLAQYWPEVLLIRGSDRIGKGIRSVPRDALIAQSVDVAHRGRAFGFHRSMDHAGAVIGPLMASLLMGVFLLTPREVFLWALIPSILAFLTLLFFLKDEPRAPQEASERATLKFHWAEFPKNFRWVLAAIFIFALGNSSDAFLLIKLTKAGIKPAWITFLWTLIHIVKMLTSRWGGSLSDRWGRRSTILLGWTVYTTVYIVFAWTDSSSILAITFLLYGTYFGLTEAAEKAWMVDMAPAHLQSTALGFYHGMVGFGALPASLLFGLIWQFAGAQVAFFFGALCALLGTLIILSLKSRSH